MNERGTTEALSSVGGPRCCQVKHVIGTGAWTFHHIPMPWAEFQAQPMGSQVPGSTDVPNMRHMFPGTGGGRRAD